jgi:hypothetical protein
MKISLFHTIFFLIFIYFAAGISSCTKDLTQSSKPIFLIDSTITDSTDFIDITLDNNRILRIENGAFSPISWSTQWGAASVDSGIYYMNRVGSSLWNSTGTNIPSFAWGKGNFNDFLFINEPPGQVPPNFTESFFAPGNYNYSVKTVDTTYRNPYDTAKLGPVNTTTLLSPGINLLWIDSAGTYWETFKGTADQTGSYFNITEVRESEAHDTMGNALGAIVAATFDCKLYDGNGHSMHLTNGKFRQSIFY